MPRTRKKTKAAPPAPKAKAKATVATAERRVVKRRGRRRGLLTGLGHHEHERDILDQYLHEVSKTPLLTQKEEIALARKVRAGGQEGMQEVVKGKLRFVVFVAKKYQKPGLPPPHPIGGGNVGPLTAARKFDPDQGVKFISYAVWWIRQAILAALARQGRTVRVPLNRTADLSRIVRTAEYLRQTLRREPTPEEIADATKLSLEVVQSLAALNTGDVRLDAPLDPDGDRSLIERFIAEDLPDTEDQAMDRFLSDEIEQALNTLQRRDAKVLRLYFGLDGGREHTLEEIGGRAVAAVEAVGRVGHFLMDTVRALPDVGTWAAPAIVQMRRIGVDSIPVTLFIAAFTGVVLALQASYTFTGAVPLYFVGTLVGKTIMLELGPVICGLALAGRVGASMAAELGTMKVTEQVDALETLAYDPQSYLVVPRVLAGTVMFPMIIAFAVATGIVTGWLTSLVLLDLSTPDFLKGLKLFYRFKDTWFGLFKSATFGATITMVGCIVGLSTRGGAEGVGKSTTRAVVYSAVLILLLDAFWAVVLL